MFSPHLSAFQLHSKESTIPSLKCLGSMTPFSSVLHPTLLATFLGPLCLPILNCLCSTVLVKSSSILTLFTLNYHLYADSFDTLIWAQILWLGLKFVSLYWIFLSKCFQRARNSLKLNSPSFSPIPAPSIGLWLTEHSLSAYD